MHTDKEFLDLYSNASPEVKSDIETMLVLDAQGLTLNEMVPFIKDHTVRETIISTIKQQGEG